MLNNISYVAKTILRVNLGVIFCDTLSGRVGWETVLFSNKENHLSWHNYSSCTRNWLLNSFDFKSNSCSGNIEFVDDLLTFADLGEHLRSHGCHVANLSSLDFSAKNGICGSIRSLLSKFLMVSLDVSILSDIPLFILNLILKEAQLASLHLI